MSIHRSLVGKESNSLILLATLGLFLTCSSTVNAEDVLGLWVVPGGDAVVRVSESDEGVQFTLIALLDSALLDENNPNEDQQTRPLQGIVLGKGFQRRANSWRGGTLYDPDSGNTYKASFQLTDDEQLQLRGYLGIPALGRTQTWMKFDRFALRMQQMLSTVTQLKGGNHD